MDWNRRTGEMPVGSRSGNGWVGAPRRSISGKAADDWSSVSRASGLWFVRIPGIRICGCFFRGHARPQPGVGRYRWDWSMLSGVAALMSPEWMAI